MSFVFPADWEDDQRMNFLFQPFRDKAANTQAYDPKIKFWKDLIKDVVKSDLLLTNENVGKEDFYFNLVSQVTVGDLCKVFTRKGVQPKCLDTVISELKREHVLTNSEIYNSEMTERISRQKAGWATWSYRVLVHPLIERTLSAVRPKPKSSYSQDNCYVINDNVKVNALSLLQKLRGQAQSSVGGSYQLLQTAADLQQQFSNLQKNDLSLALLWLESEKYLHREHLSNFGEVYKFLAKDGEKLQPLSEIDIGVLQIQQAKSKVDTNIINKQSQVDKYVRDIKEQLAKHNRPQALRLLRRKKLIERAVDKDLEHAHKLDCVLDEIYGADTLQFVLEAYGKGSKALKKLNDLHPVSMVETTMDELADNIARSEEVSAAISKPAEDVDLEQELSDLLKDAELAEADSLIQGLEDVHVGEQLTVSTKKAQHKVKLLA
ncbi:hypothetical protein EB796_019752 [Bugula neritina]|uniref:CHMP7 n=1 Tax=Bugula neritina TaxID=10212 RepID=A0A7J7J6T2_BUGNE|nr:hypothetical protein EB796_019752 [Bugula neritina]